MSEDRTQGQPLKQRTFVRYLNQLKRDGITELTLAESLGKPWTVSAGRFTEEMLTNMRLVEDEPEEPQNYCGDPPIIRGRHDPTL